MQPLTTGQVHDLLVHFTHDYPDWTISSIRAWGDYVNIGGVDVTGVYHKVQYAVRVSTEFVKINT